MKRHILLISLLLTTGGCSQITETSKVIWGSSVASLERARENAISRTYICDKNECFDAVLGLGREESGTMTEEMLSRKIFNVFIQDREEGHIVVMGVTGNVDTTKVAIFFDSYGQRSTRIEISSLSSSAKEKVAVAIFAELGRKFPEKS